MDTRLPIFFLICFIFLLLISFLKNSLIAFNEKFNFNIKYNEDKILELSKFSYDIYFNPPQADIIIENTKPCNVDVLRVCDITNQTSCSGCENLLARCVHLDYDTKYIDFEGTETIIPANQTSAEGYCVTQINENQLCNPYHGDLVFIQPNKDSEEVMLICECKNPGYIGKTTLLGACDEVFICDGKIDNINQPFESINCVCGPTYNQDKINDIPICKEKTVADYEYTMDDFIAANVNYSEIKYFASSVRSNIKATHLQNPCRYCLITGKYMPNGVLLTTTLDDGTISYQCALRDAKEPGIPVRRHPSYRILDGREGPDAIIDMDYHNILVYGYVDDAKFESMSMGIDMEKNKAILQRMSMYTDAFEYVSLNLKGHNLVYPGHFGHDSKIRWVPTIYCSHVSAPGPLDDIDYDCFFSYELDPYRQPEHYAITATEPEFEISVTTPCETPKHPFYIAYQWWKTYESYNPIFDITDVNKVNGMRKLETAIRVRRDSDVAFLFYSANRYYNNIVGFASDDTRYFHAYVAGSIPK